MTPRQTVALAVRLFVIWMAIQVLRMVPWFFAPGAFQTSSHVWNAFVVALSAAIVLLLSLSPRIIAGEQLKSSGGGQSREPTSADTWMIMGCMLIGLWTLTTAVPRLAYDTIAVNSMPYSDNSELHRWIVYNSVELCIAAWLILGAKGMRKFFHWVLNAGIEKGGLE